MMEETVKFRCKKCKTEEKIPAEIVHELDFYDNGDKKYPPQFKCEKCDGYMIPIKYHSFHGILYTWDKYKNLD